MSAATADAPAGLNCPRCGARLAPDQDWCLQCGAAASTRVVPPPSWKLAVAIVGGVIVVVAVAVVIALSSLSGDARHAASRRARAPVAQSPPTPPPAATTARTAATPTATSTTPTTSTATTGITPATSTGLATWPAGKDAWTVVLASAPDRAAAERRARDLAANGIKAGVLDTSRYTVDSGGAAFVVFTGQYDNQSAAVGAENRLGGQAPSRTYVAEVSPR